MNGVTVQIRNREISAHTMVSISLICEKFIAILKKFFCPWSCNQVRRMVTVLFSIYPNLVVQIKVARVIKAIEVKVIRHRHRFVMKKKISAMTMYRMLMKEKKRKKVCVFYYDDDDVVRFFSRMLSVIFSFKLLLLVLNSKKTKTFCRFQFEKHISHMPQCIR